MLILAKFFFLNYAIELIKTFFYLCSLRKKYSKENFLRIFDYNISNVLTNKSLKFELLISFLMFSFTNLIFIHFFDFCFIFYYSIFFPYPFCFLVYLVFFIILYYKYSLLSYYLYLKVVFI